MLKPILRGHQFIELVVAGIRSAVASDAVAVCPHGVPHLRQRCIVFHPGDVAARVSITFGIGCRCSSEQRQQQQGRQSICQCSSPLLVAWYCIGRLSLPPLPMFLIGG